MKFTGFTVSLAVAGLGYAALPVLNNVNGAVPGVEGVVGATGSAAKIVAPITSTAGG